MYLRAWNIGVLDIPLVSIARRSLVFFLGTPEQHGRVAGRKLSKLSVLSNNVVEIGDSRLRAWYICVSR